MKIDAIYARQSIDKADSISIESQIEFCQYETRGEPYRVFLDKGYSGKNTDRPGFQKLLHEIRSGQIKRVICYKLDRCSRSILDFATLMEELQKYNVEFVSCTEKFDTSTPIGRAMLNICIVFAQLERETIQQRVYDAYHSRSKKGFYMGGRIPFGYRLAPYCLEGKETSCYIPDKQESEILEFMYSVYRNPLTSLGDVVSALKEAGISHPKKENGQWTRSQIGRMLHNPIYVKADINVYDYFKNRGVIIQNAPENFIGTNGCYLYTQKDVVNGEISSEHLVLAPHAGIVSSDIWLQCNMKCRDSKSRHFKKIKSSWLVGKLKCAKCGYALVVRRITKNSGQTYRYIICSRATGSEKQCTGIRGIKAEEIEEIVSTELVKNIQMLLPYLDPSCTTNTHPIKKSRKKNDPVPDYGSIWNKLTLEDKILVADLLIQEIKLTETDIYIQWKI